MSSDYHEDSKIENKINWQDKITSHHFHAFALELKSSAGTKVEPTPLLKDFASLIWILYTIGITNLRFAKIAGCSVAFFFKLASYQSVMLHDGPLFCWHCASTDYSVFQEYSHFILLKDQLLQRGYIGK